MRINLAVGMLMEAGSVDADTARTQLEDAAQRAGVPIEELAESLVEARRTADD